MFALIKIWVIIVILQLKNYVVCHQKAWDKSMKTPPATKLLSRLRYIIFKRSTFIVWWNKAILKSSRKTFDKLLSIAFDNGWHKTLLQA